MLVDDEENGNKVMKGCAVRCYMVHIAGTCEEFGAVSPLADGQIYKELKKMDKRDKVESGSFDMVTDFPKLWIANWLRLRLRLRELRSVEVMRGFNIKEHNPTVHTRAFFAFFVNSV